MPAKPRQCGVFTHKAASALNVNPPLSIFVCNRLIINRKFCADGNAAGDGRAERAGDAENANNRCRRGATVRGLDASPLQPTLLGRQSRRRHAVLRRPDFGRLCGVADQAAEAVRAYSDFNLKMLFKDGDALITRARASLISQFLDDPSATHLFFIDAESVSSRSRCSA